MKLVFINSPLQDYSKLKKQEYYTAPPLGLGYLATIAKNQGHEARLLDAEALGLSPQEVIQYIKTEKADAVGINLLTPTLNISKNIIQGLMDSKDNLKVLVGGPHATIQPDQVLRDIKGIDILVRGEGEQTLEDLLKNNFSIDSTKGVSYIKNNQIVHNPDRELSENLDSLPLIDRTLFVKDPYKEGKHIKSVIMGSRGCHYKCTFCAGPAVSGRKIRTRSIENIVNEIGSLKERYNINRIHFIDNDFIYDTERIMSFADEIEKRNLNVEWRALARVDVVSKVGESFLKRIKQAGCYQLVFGIESGSQRILNSIKKGTSPQEAEEAVNLCKKAGIKTKAYYMFGFPTETRDEMNLTLEHAKKLNTDIACFLLVKAYPGTEMYSQLSEDHEDKQLQDYIHLQEAIPNSSISEQDRKFLSKLEEQGIYVNNFIKYNICNKNPISDVSVSDLVGVLRKAYKMYYLNGRKRTQSKLELVGV